MPGGPASPKLSTESYVQFSGMGSLASILHPSDMYPPDLDQWVPGSVVQEAICGT